MKSAILCSAVLAFSGLCIPAFANGGDFFDELQESWTAQKDSGTPYFGFVRDTNGRAIARAMVTASIPNGPDGSSLTILADSLGHYRIPGLGKTVDPKSVVIACAKAGYRAIAVNRRIMRSIPKAPIEVDCRMQPLAPNS